MANHDETNYTFLLIISAIGLGIALLSALEGHLSELAALCGLVGDGCRETAAFSLLGLPLWLWGAAYYAVLGGVILFARRAVFWLVMIAMGVEISLLQTLVSAKLICIFCILNAIVVLLLVVRCLERRRAWQAMAVSLLVFIGIQLGMKGASTGKARPEADNTAVVARVGDVAITRLELESPLATQIYKLQQEIYKLKREHLEDRINSILLQKEAEQRGVPVDQLLNDTFPGGIKVSNQDVYQHYQRNRYRWRNWTGSDEDMRNRIRTYLEREKVREATDALSEQLREKYPVRIQLPEPPLPYSKVTVGKSPVWGPADAAVTVVEFSDYLCPACRMTHETTQKIRQMYAGKIRWVFKDHPLKRHKGARRLAEAARCAGDQGHFWDFQDLLFASKGDPDTIDLAALADQLSLDADLFSKCLESGQHAADVEQDIEAGKEAGIKSTPSFIINGRLHPGGMSFEQFKQRIDEALDRTRSYKSGKSSPTNFFSDTPISN